MNIAILLAAGSGTRLGASLPKQFLEVCGKTILEHTVEAFESSDDIDEIAIVTREDYVEKVSELIGEHHPKLKRVLKGGKERYHSSIAAIEAYTNDDDNIMIHDAVRQLFCFSAKTADQRGRRCQAVRFLPAESGGSRDSGVPFRPAAEDGQYRHQIRD